MINLTKELKNRRYLYVLKPIENADDPDNKVEETTKKIIEDMNAGFERTNEEIDVLKKKMLQLVSQHNSMNFEMKEGF
jgi:predicted oxidoreductase (fatty acid repression mutant protein)